jgi:nucleotide-binding universal stress UspA family protein
MTYATLMVQVDVDGELGGRVRIARDLADRFGAHLIGVGAWAPMSVFLAEEAKVDPTPSEPHLQDMKALLDQKGQQFCAAAGSADRKAEWRSVLDFPTDAVAREARAADLVIVGNAAENRDPFRALDPGGLILKAGRPILVVPKFVDALSPRRIAIAWKDTREARRAVRDALPFLRRADSVAVFEVCESGEEKPAQHRLQDVARYLARHGVNGAYERLLPIDATVSNSLLRFVKSEAVDLVVAGAYGHTRLGEWIFGGITRDLLTSNAVCCLFSH